MTQLAALAPGASVGLAKPAQVVAEPVGRARSWLIYSVLHLGQRRKLLEYAPAGLVWRDPADAIALVEGKEAFAAEWRQALDRVEQLGNALKTLPGSPGIRKIVECERAAGTIYLLAEDRADLKPLSGDALAPETVAIILDGLVRAIGAAHDADLLHLDIALQTVLVDDRAVMLQAFSPDERPLIKVIGDRAPFVTPPFSAMELYDETGRATLSPSTDIYAASALLYRLVTGKDAPGWHERSGASGPSARPAAEGYSEAFLDAIDRGLSTDPARSFLDVGQWREAMGADILAPRRSGPGRAVIILVILLAALAIAAAAYGWREGWFGDGNSPEGQIAPSPAVTPPETNETDRVGGDGNGDGAKREPISNSAASAPIEEFDNGMTPLPAPEPDRQETPVSPPPKPVVTPQPSKPVRPAVHKNPVKPSPHPSLPIEHHHTHVSKPPPILPPPPKHSESCGYKGC